MYLYTSNPSGSCNSNRQYVSCVRHVLFLINKEVVGLRMTAPEIHVALVVFLFIERVLTWVTNLAYCKVSNTHRGNTKYRHTHTHKSGTHTVPVKDPEGCKRREARFVITK